MIRSIFGRAALALASLSLVFSPALADMTVKDGAGNSQTIGTTVCHTTSLCTNVDTVIQASRSIALR